MLYSQPLGEKVSLFVAGVQKGGTTALFSYLREHPELSSPSRKELHYFDNDTLDWESPDYTPYHNAFPDGIRRIRFDVTPSYFYWPNCAKRIHLYNSDAKFIILFRCPAERSYSHWCMEYARGYESELFSRAIRHEFDRLAKFTRNDPRRRIFSYVTRGFYGLQTARLLSFFPPQNVLWILSDDLRSAPERTLARIADFLSIRAFNSVDQRKVHARPTTAFPSLLTRADRQYIREVLSHDTEYFRYLTGLTTDSWYGGS